MSKSKETPVLGFVDHHRQHYADRVRIAEAGEFLIGEHLSDGSLGAGGVFKVELVDLQGPGGRWVLNPRLTCFGDAVGLLRRAIEAGLLDAVGPVSDRGAFARRLIAMGMVDRSDRQLGGAGHERGDGDGRRSR
jgi:hypothetical protein